MSRKVVVAASLSDESLEALKHLKNNPLIQGSQVELVHVFRTEVMINELVPYAYPSPEDYDAIEKSVTEILDRLGNDLGAAEFQTKVLFHADPKHKFCEYAKEAGADLIVVATRGLSGVKGLFSSSFADYINKHTESDVYVIR